MGQARSRVGVCDFGGHRSRAPARECFGSLHAHDGQRSKLREAQRRHLGEPPVPPGLYVGRNHRS